MTKIVRLQNAPWFPFPPFCRIPFDWCWLVTRLSSTTGKTSTDKRCQLESLFFMILIFPDSFFPWFSFFMILFFHDCFLHNIFSPFSLFTIPYDYYWLVHSLSGKILIWLCLWSHIDRLTSALVASSHLGDDSYSKERIWLKIPHGSCSFFPPVQKGFHAFLHLVLCILDWSPLLCYVSWLRWEKEHP